MVKTTEKKRNVAGSSKKRTVNKTAAKKEMSTDKAIVIDKSTLKELHTFCLKHKKSVATVAILIASVIFNVYWLIGIFLILWALNDYVRGETYLFEEISVSKTPYLYWSIITMWALFGLGIIVNPPVFF